VIAQPADQLAKAGDREICEALGARVTEEDLLNLYGIFVKEMIITRRSDKRLRDIVRDIEP
jgi:hypothetical protein